MQDGDSLLTSQSDLEAHILRFYEQLYTKDEEVEHNAHARENCFQYIHPKVTEEHNAIIVAAPHYGRNFRCHETITRREITRCRFNPCLILSGVVGGHRV